MSVHYGRTRQEVKEQLAEWRYDYVTATYLLLLQKKWKGRPVRLARPRVLMHRQLVGLLFVALYSSVCLGRLTQLLLLLPQPFYGPVSWTTWVSHCQKKHSPTHVFWSLAILYHFFHLLRSVASSLFNLRARQSFCTTFVHVLFGLPLGLEPSTSYSIHFFTQSVQHMIPAIYALPILSLLSEANILPRAGTRAISK